MSRNKIIRQRQADTVSLEAFEIMKLPNGEHAIVEIDKWLHYCLDSDHPRGRHKARVFASGARPDD